ncbi:sister chromatid cohesion protein DCC1 isoform X2 [Panulirus ornatus]|uniref:sister chromatid cohesion protein DCC1 isoform X2 n=1 Tax=Panulirus ornatus TaxID=150431 RepID=UPI003A88FDCD
MSCIGRTVEDVKKLVHHAKLVEDELHPITQVLEFTPDFGCDGKEIVLLELDAKVLETLKEDSAVLRGDPEAGAVLCTKSRTYEVREAETSNSLVLIPHLSLATGEGSKERTLQNRQVCGIHHTYLEIRPCKPRTQKLRELLEECPYSGSQGENQDGEKTRYTWSDLLDLVQCSEEELDKALQELEAYHLYGDTLYTLRDDKVCRLCAEVLLRSADKYNLHEFLSIWQQSVPEGLTTNLSQLEGLALVDRSSSSDAISYFPVTSLPQDIQDRFNTLFATRDKWTFEEIRPYIEDLAGDKTPVNALLTKYARASTLNGIKYYSGKHAR